MVIYVLKIAGMFFATMAAVRVLGKTNLSGLTPYDLAALIMVGTLITGPLVSAELGQTVLGLAGLVASYLLFFLLARIPKVKKFLLGTSGQEIKAEKVSANRPAGNQKARPALPVGVAPPARKPLPAMVNKKSGQVEQSFKDRSATEIQLIKNGLILTHGLRQANLKKKTLVEFLKQKGVRDPQQIKEAWINSFRQIRVKKF